MKHFHLRNTAPVFWAILLLSWGYLLSFDSIWPFKCVSSLRNLSQAVNCFSGKQLVSKSVSKELFPSLCNCGTLRCCEGDVLLRHNLDNNCLRKLPSLATEAEWVRSKLLLVHLHWKFVVIVGLLLRLLHFLEVLINSDNLVILTNKGWKHWIFRQM